MISLIKRVSIYLLLFLVVFWTTRIISINRNTQKITEYRIGDEINCGDLLLHPIESDLFSTTEFYGTMVNNDSIDDYVITICFEVTNNSDADMDWDSILNFIALGFEADLWCSSVNPEYYRYQNEHLSNSLAPNESQKIWLSTIVSRICFRESTWKDIKNVEFFYVLHLSPDKIVVRLDI